MKKLIMLSVFMLIGNVAFSNTKEVKKQTCSTTTTQNAKIFKAAIPIYCGGKLKGYINCDSCTTEQLANAAWAMCN